MRSTDFTVNNPPSVDHLLPGTAQMADLDGDDRPGPVVTTYIGGTSKTRAHETRVYQQLADDNFACP